MFSYILGAAIIIYTIITYLNIDKIVTEFEVGNLKLSNFAVNRHKNTTFKVIFKKNHQMQIKTSKFVYEVGSSSFIQSRKPIEMINLSLIAKYNTYLEQKQDSHICPAVSIAL